MYICDNKTLRIQKMSFSKKILNRDRVPHQK